MFIELSVSYCNTFRDSRSPSKTIGVDNREERFGIIYTCICPQKKTWFDKAIGCMEKRSTVNELTLFNIKRSNREREFQFVLHNLPITIISLSPFPFFTEEYYLTEGTKKKKAICLFFLPSVKQCKCFSFML